MRIYGVVRGARKEKVINGAKVSFFVGDIEVAVLYSDREGLFDHREQTSYLGEILTWEVEKDGYRVGSGTYKIEEEEVALELELVPAPPPPSGPVKEAAPPKPEKKSKKWPWIVIGIVLLLVILALVYFLFIAGNGGDNGGGDGNGPGPRPRPGPDDFKIIPPKVMKMAPTQAGPPDGAVFHHLPRHTLLEWHPLPDVERYCVEVQFQTGSGWSTLLREDGLPHPNFEFEFVGMQAGRWRVWAVHTNGTESPKSKWRKFRYTQ